MRIIVGLPYQRDELAGVAGGRERRRGVPGFSDRQNILIFQLGNDNRNKSDVESD